jgi:asparagine synthase (glutamine-hydrolysing)
MLDELRAALLDSVRHHLVADVPVGVFLSSGLDSATLTGLAREASNQPLHTVTLGFAEFRGTASDEVPSADLIARHYGTHHQTQWVHKTDFEAEYPRVLDAMDQPSTDGVNTYFVSKAAADAGMKVTLSGLGGDELFGGYPSFQQLPRLVKACKGFQSIPRLGRAFRFVAAPLLKHLTSPKYAGILQYGGSYSGAYLLRRGMFMPWELPGVLDPEIVRKGWDELEPLARLDETTAGIASSHLKVTALESAWYMRNQLLRDADWASMAHSLEVRVPLVDVQLSRVVVRLLSSRFPPDKLSMALVVAKALPAEVLNRKKTGFSIPTREWLLRGSQSADKDRGLRGWAKHLYAAIGSPV